MFESKRDKKNILVVGSHPDDIESGCGGTIVKHIELGDRVFALILTKGEKGNHPDDKNECISSLKLLGINESDIIFGDFPDGDLPNSFEVINLIESFIKKFDISRAYTHHINDRHQDHRNCSLSVSSAARNIPELLLYQGPSTKDPFEPHYFIEISEQQLNKKISALEVYKSQIEKGIINLKAVEGLASVYGAKCRAEYAEAFALNHLFKEGENV